MKRTLRKVGGACRLLDAGRIDDALETIKEVSEESILTESVFLTARGLAFEREGRTSEALDCFERVFAHGVPLPALLRQSGRYFKRAGRYERSYHCYSVLESFRPPAINEFLEDLPEPELSRYAPWGVSGFRPRRRGFYELQPIKAALANQLGPEAAAFVYAHLAGLEQGWDVARKRMAGLQDFAKEHALVYEELSPSKDVSLPTPPLFGVPRQGGSATTTRTFFFCALADVVVANKSSFLLAGDRALFDVQGDELTRIALDLDLDPIVFGPVGKAVTVLIDGRASTGRELDRALPLTGVTNNNFGHWLLEYLPKVFACLGRPGFDSVPILIDGQMPSQHREALELFVGAEHPIVVLDRDEAVRVKEVWACSMVTYLPLGPKPGQDPEEGVLTGPNALALDAEMFAGLIEKLQPTLEAAERPSGPRRIYLARSDSQHRRLVNRPQVEGWFLEQGFEIFNFGKLPFREQLELARGADVIVGPDGSSTFITFFARPGTRIGLLTNAYAEDCEWYTLVCGALGQRLSVLTGEIVQKNADYRTFSAYEIDVEVLPAFMEDLLTGD